MDSDSEDSKTYEIKVDVKKISKRDVEALKKFNEMMKSDTGRSSSVYTETKKAYKSSKNH